MPLVAFSSPSSLDRTSPALHLGLLYHTCRECETWCQLAAVSTRDQQLGVFFARVADQRSVFGHALRTALVELRAAPENDEPRAGTPAERGVAAAVSSGDDRRALINATLAGERALAGRCLHALAAADLSAEHRNLVSDQYTAVLTCCDLLCGLLHLRRSAA